jgi:hypothetical protein
MKTTMKIVIEIVMKVVQEMAVREPTAAKV